MSFFRNQEIRKQIIISLLLLIFTGGIGFYLFPDNRAGIAYAFWCCLAMCLLWLIFTKMRYSHLKNLAADADRMLHGERNLNFTSYQEGELAILANEVEKLLWRLTEQSDNLLKEKRYLSDSLADISHQLRTPLTSLHLLLTRLQEAEDEREKRRLAYEGAQLLGRVDWLVNALLKISKIDAGTAVFAKERVDAEALVEKALKPLSIPMELREQAVVREMEDRAGFTGDAAWTVEALGNLMADPGLLGRCQTYAFTVLGISQLFHAVGMRDVETSLFRMNHLGNKLMLLAVVLGFLLQLLVTEVPYFVGVFGTCSLAFPEWLMLLLLSAMPLLAHEILAWIKNLR